MEQQEIIIKLIKDDLTNNKLIDGLNGMGLEADHYYLYLSEIIFEMIGITLDNKNFDRVYKLYEKLTKHAQRIDIKERNGQMDTLAKEVYTELCQLKDLLDKEEGEN